MVLAMITDADGRLAFANSDLLALGGWEWSQLEGRMWHEVLIPPEHRHRAARAFDRALLEGDAAAGVEVPLRSVTGTPGSWRGPPAPALARTAGPVPSPRLGST